MKPDAIAGALTGTLISPNESDSNLEPANVVDALYFVGRSIRRATASEATCPETGTAIDLVEALYILGKAGERMANALQDIAEAIRSRELP